MSNMTNTGTAQTRGRVERVEGEHDIQPFRRWVTWRTYFDGAFLGNAVDEAEGWRWIDDMVKLEARTDAERRAEAGGDDFSEWWAQQ